MKSSGISRKVDDLGRIVIPSEMRKALGLREGDQLDITVDDDRLILKRREETCIFCRSTQDLKEFMGRMVCATCITDLSGGPDPAPWEPFTETQA